MHELSITESILDITLRHARESNASKVNHLYLVIGQLASIVDDSVQFYWDMVAKDTLAEGAQLHFKRIPAELECRQCQTRYQPDGLELACPACHGVTAKIISGEEFFLEAIDIEVSPEIIGGEN